MDAVADVEAIANKDIDADVDIVANTDNDSSTDSTLKPTPTLMLY